MFTRRLVSLIVAVGLAAGSVSATTRNSRERAGDPGKDKAGTQGITDCLGVQIRFSGSYGQTVTDENGTTYYAMWWTCHENKVYPPEYWGVFPLYFFGSRVGITITLKNNSPAKDASLKLLRTCNVLNLDGSNGTELSPPRTMEVHVPAGQTKTLDGSFVVMDGSAEDAGLDRFLLKIFGAPVVTYTSVEHMNSGSAIKFGDATEGLGEDGRHETDTFVVDVPGGGTAVSVTTKASTGEVTSTLNGVGSSVTDTLGFKSTLVGISGGRYTISVRSVANSHALSHVQFGFGSAARVLAPADGSARTVTRTTDEDGTLLLLKEAVFCPPHVDAELLDQLGVAIEE